MMANRGLAPAYLAIRKATERLCAPLAVEDHVVQPIDDVSPPKWHLGHTTWFFETFSLERRLPGYQALRPEYRLVFNSYYQSLGTPYPRSRRGTRSRPTVSAVYAYRAAVDEKIAALLERGLDAEGLAALELGLHHEQQHQELLAADIKLILAHNDVPTPPAEPRAAAAPLTFVSLPGGLFRMGNDGAGFAFDNERPAYDVLMPPFKLARRLTTNAEFREFIDDGGYRDFRHWLADGWDRARSENWEAPLYWSDALDPNAPALHLSGYEADAFARWAGKRLPTEAEWELAARTRPFELEQLFDEAWQWTSSAYGPYPGFRPLPGAFGEYNGKFMSGQLVLRGGSRATPAGHTRSTYRNFFQPEKRWQFTGVRLACDD